MFIFKIYRDQFTCVPISLLLWWALDNSLARTLEQVSRLRLWQHLWLPRLSMTWKLFRELVMQMPIFWLQRELRHNIRFEIAIWCGTHSCVYALSNCSCTANFSNWKDQEIPHANTAMQCGFGSKALESTLTERKRMLSDCCCSAGFRRIIQCIAEKLNTVLPGVYDADEFE